MSFAFVALAHRTAAWLVAMLCLIAPCAVAGVQSAWAQPAPEKSITVAEAIEAIPSGQKPPGRHALVIGAGSFLDKRVPALPACGNDARGVEQTLIDPSVGMFPRGNVTLLEGAQVTKPEVINALERLSRAAGKDDLVVVFFSGHGATDEKGRAYWVMHDTKPDQLRATALPETDISELLGEIKTTRLVTIIDACYSAATANLDQKSKSLIDLGKLYPEFQGDGRVGLTASKGDQLSIVISDKSDPGYGYSAFAWHVIQGLRGQAADAQGVVTVDALWSYVKDRTEQTARRQGGNQQPQLKGQFGSKFLLAINADRMRERAAADRAASARTRLRVQRLAAMLVDGKISTTHVDEGRTLLQSDEASLDESRKGRRRVYEALTDEPPRLDAEFLDAALSKFPRSVPQHVQPVPQPNPTPSSSAPTPPRPAQADTTQSPMKPVSPSPFAEDNVKIVEVGRLKGLKDWVRSVAFSPDGMLFAGGSGGAEAMVWDITGRTPPRSLSIPADALDVYDITFSPDGLRVATASRNSATRIWNTATGEQLLAFDKGPTYRIAFSRDGRSIVVAHGGKHATVWDASSGARLRTLQGHSDSVLDVAIDPTGLWIATGSADATVKIFNAETGTLIRTLMGHTGAIQDIEFSADGQLIATAADDKAVRIWDIASGRQVQVLRTAEYSAEDIAFSPDGGVIATAHSDPIRLWSVRTGALIRQVDEVGSGFARGPIAFSPDGRWLAACARVKEVVILGVTSDLSSELSKYPFETPRPPAGQPVQPGPVQPGPSQPQPSQPRPTQPAPTQPVAGGPQHLARKTVELAPGVTAEFVYIDAPGVAPNGFLMGSPSSEEGRDDNEVQHRVKLTKGFWVQTTEVTQGQWQAVLGSNPAYFKNGPTYPVEQVSWEDCQEFIGKLRSRGIAARLPTEAEWEFACRAGTTTPFSFRATISTEQANYDGNYTYGAGRKGVYREKTTRVGSFAANAWGLFDMHGNVWEWCQDWYGEYPTGATTIDPAGPQTGSDRVLRGGSWNYDPRNLRSAFRFRYAPTNRNNNIGFRFCLDSE
ncbi:MAG: SUMF1/EgtB/PvdO family nonheme iron enzyme [Planctomycetota bacterium]|nr:SUMF1/EgtB/PvdO family nonheme iron enzyme [Planctomycetota bacterium]